MNHYKLHTKQRNLKSLIESYEESFHDFDKIIWSVDALEKKIIKKSLESLEWVRESIPTELHVTSYMPEHLWLPDEIKDWEETTGFTFSLRWECLWLDSSNEYLLYERNKILKWMNTGNEPKLEWIWIILDRLEKMFDYAVRNERPIKSFMWTFNTFTSGKYD